LDRSIRALLLAQFTSSTGYTAMGTVLGLQVFEMSHRELDLGLLGAFQFAPVLLLLLVTGSASDRGDRAAICALAAAGQAVACLLLAGYATMNPSAVWPIFAMVTGVGVARAFLSAAQGPLPADLVEPTYLPWLVARRSLVSRPGLILGPIIAGTLYVISPGAAFLASALFFVAAAAFYLLLRGHRRAAQQRPKTPANASALVHESAEGLRVIRRTPVLLGAISLDLFAVLFGGAVALLPALATEHLLVGSVGLGILRAAAGVGSAVVLLLLAWRSVDRHVGPTLFVTIAVFGAATVVLGATTNVAVAAAAMAILSGADAISVYIRGSLVPLAAPVHARGRVSAVESLFIGASNELGALESGITGQVLGSSGAVILGGVATLTVVGAYSVLFPSLRTLDRYPSVPEPPPIPSGLTPLDLPRDPSTTE
jgi:MFS family permease